MLGTLCCEALVCSFLQCLQWWQQSEGKELLSTCPVQIDDNNEFMLAFSVVLQLK